MIREVCVCGNELERRDSRADFICRRRPCRCAIPGNERQPPVAQDMPRFVTERQYNERKRLGLPVACPAELAERQRWV